MRVSVLGAGIMGSAVTASLLRHGHEVTVWNRSLERARPLGDAGATVASTPAEAIRDAEAVLVTVFDGGAVLGVMAEALTQTGSDAVWLQASTIGLEDTGRVVDLATERGVNLLEAMMLGTKAPAEQGKLTLLVAGDPSYDDQVRPVFDAIAAKVLWVGPTVGQATALKLVTNAWVGAITAATAQSIALAQGLGLDARLFLEAIDGAPVDSLYAHIKGEAMMASKFDPSFSVEGVIKDIDLMIAAARQAEIDESLLTTVRSLFARAAEGGHADADMAAVVTTFPLAGREG